MTRWLVPAWTGPGSPQGPVHIEEVTMSEEQPETPEVEETAPAADEAADESGDAADDSSDED
jgi:hypothetical protein